MKGTREGASGTGPSVLVMQQNMALLPPLRLPNGQNLYLGHEREAALDSLLHFLRSYLPDIVGLSEMWVNDERDWLRTKLDRSYPFYLEGPGEADDLNLDGGLMLLSRTPFIAHQEAIYDPCLGEDCLAQKGVLHARTRLFGEAPSLDLFLTHLQNPTPLLAGPDIGPGSGGRGKIQAQLDRLATFIGDNRDPHSPALLMGDLNTNASLPEEYDDLLARLDRPLDLWTVSDGGGRSFGRNGIEPLKPVSGLTFDEENTFSLAELPEDQDSKRHVQGKRLDYFLSYPGRDWQPSYTRTMLLRLESSPGRDSSDHYGLMTELAAVRRT